MLFAASTFAVPAWPLIGAPIVEEIIFRLGLQSELMSRLGPRLAGLANALTALVFSLAHGLSQSSPWAWMTLLPALAIGCVYARSRRLAPCVALHATCNAIWFLPINPVL